MIGYQERPFHYTVALGAGRTDTGLTHQSVDRLDAAIDLAVELNALGVVVLGGYGRPWLGQKTDFAEPGSDLRRRYLYPRAVSEGLHIIKIPFGNETLHELMLIRESRLGLEKFIIVTHPEHVPRVQKLSELIFWEQVMYPHSLEPRYSVQVTSHTLPSGTLSTGDEKTYLDITVSYLQKMYPPEGKIPIHPFWHRQDVYNPTNWAEKNRALLDALKSRIDPTLEVYRMPSDK